MVVSGKSGDTLKGFNWFKRFGITSRERDFKNPLVVGEFFKHSGPLMRVLGRDVTMLCESVKN